MVEKIESIESTRINSIWRVGMQLHESTVFDMREAIPRLVKVEKVLYLKVDRHYRLLVTAEGKCSLREKALACIGRRKDETQVHDSPIFFVVNAMLLWNSLCQKETRLNFGRTTNKNLRKR